MKLTQTEFEQQIKDKKRVTVSNRKGLIITLHAPINVALECDSEYVMQIFTDDACITHSNGFELDTKFPKDNQSFRILLRETE